MRKIHLFLQKNDDWRSDKEAEIEETGAQPESDQEAAMVVTLAPGAYTAIVRGQGGTTGLGMVEVFHVPGAAGITGRLSKAN